MSVPQHRLDHLTHFGFFIAPIFLNAQTVSDLINAVESIQPDGQPFIRLAAPRPALDGPLLNDLMLRPGGCSSWPRTPAERGG
jgi:hypothetical protein